MKDLFTHIAEEGILGGTGYLVIQALGFGRVQSDYESTKLLKMCDGRLFVGWFFTNLVGALTWVCIVALIIYML